MELYQHSFAGLVCKLSSSLQYFNFKFWYCTNCHLICIYKNKNLSTLDLEYFELQNRF